MPSSHCRHRQDKTVLSCLVGVRGVNWIGDKSRLSATENFETVLSSLVMRCELSLVFSWPSFQFARNVVTGQNCSVSNILRTTENCLRLSPTQFTQPTLTRRDSLVLSVSAVWTRHYKPVDLRLGSPQVGSIEMSCHAKELLTNGKWRTSGGWSGNALPPPQILQWQRQKRTNALNFSRK